MRSLVLAVALPLALLSACAGSSSTGAPATTLAGQVVGGQGEPVTLVDDPAAPGYRFDRASLSDLRVAGHTLHVTATYGGGCREHRFALLVVRGFMESYPVQVRARLSHDANEDPCRALPSTPLAFDLTPLRDEYRHAYRTEHGAIVIQLEGTEGVRYEF